MPAQQRDTLSPKERLAEVRHALAQGAPIESHVIVTVVRDALLGRYTPTPRAVSRRSEDLFSNHDRQQVRDAVGTASFGDVYSAALDRHRDAAMRSLLIERVRADLKPAGVLDQEWFTPNRCLRLNTVIVEIVGMLQEVPPSLAAAMLSALLTDVTRKPPGPAATISCPECHEARSRAGRRRQVRLAVLTLRAAGPVLLTTPMTAPSEEALAVKHEFGLPTSGIPQPQKTWVLTDPSWDHVNVSCDRGHVIRLYRRNLLSQVARRLPDTRAPGGFETERGHAC
jgi:hypothetical protein